MFSPKLSILSEEADTAGWHRMWTQIGHKIGHGQKEAHLQILHRATPTINCLIAINA